MMTHPGKKLMFMGCELGMFREWDFADQLEWFLLKYDMHASMQLFVAELNRLYLASSPLWERDDRWEGFSWIDADNADQSIFSYRRIDEKGRELVVLINFTPVQRDDFLLAVPKKGRYEEVFNSDHSRFGGSGVTNGGILSTEPCEGLRGGAHAIRISVPPMSGLIFRPTKNVNKKI